MKRATLLPFVLVLLAASLVRADTADYSRTPVLMIHGWFVLDLAGEATWADFRKRLIADGWPAEYLYAPSFQDVQGCDPEHAQQIAAWVKELKAKTQRSKVDILAHSEGGLNTLHYLRDLCGVRDVRHFVAVAPAFHGTVVACLGAPFSCGAEEMCIGSQPGDWKENPALLSATECDETPGDVLYTSIWSPFDEIIVPPTGSILAGADNRQVQTKWVEHGGIFLADEPYGYVKEALLHGGKNTDGPGWNCIPHCAPEVTPDSGIDAGGPDVPDPGLDPAGDAADGVPDRTSEDRGDPGTLPADPGGIDPGRNDRPDHATTRVPGLSGCGAGSDAGADAVLALWGLAGFTLAFGTRTRSPRTRRPSTPTPSTRTGATGWPPR